MNERSTTKTVWLAAGVLLPFAAAFAVVTTPYLPFLSDDSLISLRYARRFLDGFGLTWTDGRPVEGYSNLLWILAVAAIGSLGADLIDAARLLGVGCSVAIMFTLVWRYVRQPDLRLIWLGVVAGLSFLALAAPLAVWAIGGLEQPLLVALLAASIVVGLDEIDRPLLDRRRTQWLSLALGLVCLTRPDGPIFAVVTAVAMLIPGGPGTGRVRLQRAGLVLLFPVLLSAAQLVFRLVYYGEWVPNTALFFF